MSTWYCPTSDLSINIDKFAVLNVEQIAECGNVWYLVAYDTMEDYRKKTWRDAYLVFGSPKKKDVDRFHSALLNRRCVPTYQDYRETERPVGIDDLEGLTVDGKATE